MSSDVESSEEFSSGEEKPLFTPSLKTDFTVSTPSDSEEEKTKLHKKEEIGLLSEKNLKKLEDSFSLPDSESDNQSESDQEGIGNENKASSVCSSRKSAKSLRKLSTSSSEFEIDEKEEEKLTEQLIDGLKSDLKAETDKDGNQQYLFDINSDSRSGSEYEKDDEEIEREVMEQMRRLLLRRNGKHSKARRRWLDYERKQKEAEEEAKQFQAYWDRRHEEDRDLWRNKDFANAIDKMSRAGYKGKHGNFDVPGEIIKEFNALYMQITVGDYDGNEDIDCIDEWKKLKGQTRVECQRQFIKKTNKTITQYGWNPPPGWT